MLDFLLNSIQVSQKWFHCHDVKDFILLVRTDGLYVTFHWTVRKKADDAVLVCNLGRKARITFGEMVDEAALFPSPLPLLVGDEWSENVRGSWAVLLLSVCSTWSLLLQGLLRFLPSYWNVRVSAQPWHYPRSPAPHAVPWLLIGCSNGWAQTAPRSPPAPGAAAKMAAAAPVAY